MINKIIALAKEQIGNGYNKYCEAFGFNYRIEWCAAFISWLSKKLELENIVFQSMSCTQMTKWYKAKNVWHEKGEMPQAGDILFYDWNPEEMDGIDHVGIVETVSGNDITVIEGNNNDKVARRIISKDYSMIYGFAHPDYPSDSVPANAQPSEQSYTVQSGDTLSQIAEKYGTTYKKLAEYNAITNPDLIYIGQIIKIPSSDSSSVKPANPFAEPSVNITKGSSGNDVKWVQWSLQNNGYSIGKYGIDGICGNDTFDAIKRFQSDNNLSVDGICGPLTRNALKK